MQTPATSPYTLSLHDALPICARCARQGTRARAAPAGVHRGRGAPPRAGRAQRPREEVSDRRGGVHRDRKSTRLNSSHLVISYAVFCLTKKIKRKTRKKDNSNK